MSAVILENRGVGRKFSDCGQVSQGGSQLLRKIWLPSSERDLRNTDVSKFHKPNKKAEFIWNDENVLESTDKIVLSQCFQVEAHLSCVFFRGQETYLGGWRSDFQSYHQLAVYFG
jgi:hypothetical protein